MLGQSTPFLQDLFLSNGPRFPQSHCLSRCVCWHVILLCHFVFPSLKWEKTTSQAVVVKAEVTPVHAELCCVPCGVYVGTVNHFRMRCLRTGLSSNGLLDRYATTVFCLPSSGAGPKTVVPGLKRVRGVAAMSANQRANV